MNRTLRTGVIVALGLLAVGVVLAGALWSNGVPMIGADHSGGADRLGGAHRPGGSDAIIRAADAIVRAGDAITDRAYLPALAQGSPEWNLLRNADLQGTYVQFSYFQTAVVAPQWLPWWKAQAAGDEAWKNRMPWFQAAAPYQNRIHSGGNAQQLYTQNGTHIAGVYQRVQGVPPVSQLRFSIWGQAWAGNGDDPSESVGGGPMHMRVGIDPSGESDPFSPDVVWSEEQNPLDRWSLFVVEAWAQGDEVTVYTGSARIHRPSTTTSGGMTLR